MANVTGTFTLGKTYTLLLVAACWVYARRWLRHLGATAGLAALGATAIAANPVAMSQAFSMYLDGALASLVTLALFACAAIAFGRARALDTAVLAISATMLVAIKFTGVAYLAVMLLVTSAVALLCTNGWNGRTRRLRPLALAAACATLFGVLILGFNPYLTNVEQGHHPMYPLAGQGKIDIMAHHISPVVFTDARRNRLQNLGLSVFSRSQPNLEAPVWKMPFTTNLRELRSFTAPDVHLAGWGVFFSGTLLASVGLWLYGRGWRCTPEAGFAAGLVVLTVLCNPYAWWARFAPQLALLPVLLVVPWIAHRPAGKLSHKGVLAVVLCGLLVADAAINVGCALAASALPTVRMHRTLARAAAECGPGTYLAYSAPGAMPYHYEPFSGYRGITIQSAPAAQAAPRQVVAYPFGVSWAAVDLVRVGGCNLPAPVR